MRFFWFEKLGVSPRFSNVREVPMRGLSAVSGKFFFSAVLLGLVLIASTSVSAQERQPTPANSPEAVRYGWADVLRVDPVFEGGTGDPQQECYEEQVLVQPAQISEPDDGKRVGGTVLGAIIGGVIGNRFGKGDGRKAATAAGAIAGGAIGNNIASSSGSSVAVAPPRYSTQRRCRQVEGAAPRHVIAYDVEYRYRGELYTARMNTDPGDRMRVRVSVTPAE